MKNFRGVLIVGGVLSVSTFVPANAMPVPNLAKVSYDAATSTQNVVCRPHRCGQRRSYYYYAPVVIIPRVYYGGCAPGWIGCGPYSYGGWYQPPGSEGYRGWPYY